MPIKHIIKTDGTIVSADDVSGASITPSTIVESGRDNQITSHGFSPSGTLSDPWPISDKREFKNDPLNSDKFVPRYRLEGLEGSSFLYNAEESEKILLEVFKILGKCAAYATSFGAIVQVATSTSFLGGERNNNTGRQIGYKSHNRDKLGKYKNYLHGYSIRYLEKINFPVDIAQPFIKGEGLVNTLTAIGKNLANEADYILLTNIYLLVGITEYFYKGNILNDKFDNLITNLIIEQSFTALNPAKDTLTKVPVIIMQIINLIIEAVTASEEAINAFRMLSNKISNKESFNNTLNEEESPYLENNGDPVIRFLHEQTQDYLFKFTIERINVGKELIKIAVSKKKYDTSGNLITSDERHYNTFGKLEKYDAKVPLDNKNRNSASIVALPQAFLLGNVAKTSANLALGVVEDNFKDVGNKNRLTVEQAKEVEDALNSEYMPFSIQDLRTREVIGLHAFIDSFSDTFSANYDESGGFGRVDKIQRWENTTRSITMSFYMISYNEDDHDLMWYQINKLVTMLYPQWSETVGTVYYSEGAHKGKEAFKFPFTKVPTATPLVRIRLGDVMTSNYSNISIRREHGYGTRAEDISLSKIKHKLIKNTYIVYLDKNPLKNLQEIKAYLSVENNKQFFKTVVKEAEVNIKQIFDENNIIVELEGVPVFAKKSDFVDTQVFDGIAPLEVEEKSQDKLNNPITAGYETTMGEGLAGVIKSFNIEFSKELPWDIREGSRAPIYTKATLQFTPIHDIPPGLDHTGMMRAPVYKVGNIIRSMHYDIKSSKKHK